MKKLEENNKKRNAVGFVVSDKMDKTIVVEIYSRRLHPLYKKYILKRKKFKVHDEKDEAKTGDKVRILESRPYSKEKSWKLAEIIERSLE